LHNLNPASFISLPIAAVLFLLGISVTLVMPSLPALPWTFAMAVSAISLLTMNNKYLLKHGGIFLLGFAFMAYQVNQHLATQLPAELNGQTATVIANISSVVEVGADNKLSFIAEILSLAHAVGTWPKPGLIKITWEQPAYTPQPGQQWFLTVKLKKPRDYANPGSFASEKLFFQQRIAALGYVLPDSGNQLIQESRVIQNINKLRQYLCAKIVAGLANQRFAGVIVALVVGNKNLITTEQWRVFQNTGTAHLMAISGMHLGIIASIVFIAIKIFWRFAPANFLHIPAPWLAACAALTISLMYAALAGLSVSTQRSIIMLAVYLLGTLWRRKISVLQKFCLALLLVLIFDPFVILSVGFWFSFLAVGFLLYAFAGRKLENNNWLAPWRWLRPQMVVAIGLLPISLLFFAQTAIYAPAINLLAIPWVCFLVLPLSLLGAVLLLLNINSGIVLLKLAELNFSVLWDLLNLLQDAPIYFWQPPTRYLLLTMWCAMLGALWLFVPKGLPGRFWSIFSFVALFLPRIDNLLPEQVEFTLLDVGQGLAAVIRTQRHVLIYDTGAKKSTSFDLGSRVVIPYLRTIGVQQIDTLLISHADNDHIGGAESILTSMQVQKLMLNDQTYLPAYNKHTCLAGKSWTWDGVKFMVLHPNNYNNFTKRNDQSCVLQVQAGKQKILLTGDIETKAELNLIASYGSQLQADLLLVPHHGSKTSSSVEFIQAVRPKYALIPVGYKNQYGHPKQQILQRYQDLQVPVLRTDLDGAISFKFGQAAESKLQPQCYRREQSKFWLAK